MTPANAMLNTAMTHSTINRVFFIAGFPASVTYVKDRDYRFTRSINRYQPQELAT
jgi:hypothetical protein